MNDARTAAAADAGTPAWILRTGGIAALLLAAGYLATIPLFAAVGAPPSGAQARLEYHATTRTLVGIVALSVLTDLLLLPVAISLYAALRRSSQPAMLLATAFTLLFVVLDLAVTWPAYASLITLGQQYAGVDGRPARPARGRRGPPVGRAQLAPPGDRQHPDPVDRDPRDQRRDEPRRVWTGSDPRRGGHRGTGHRVGSGNRGDGNGQPPRHRHHAPHDRLVLLLVGRGLVRLPA